MKTYKEIKEAIKRSGHTTKYFTKAFLDTYRAAVETVHRNLERGVDDTYWDGDIFTRHAYDDVRKTDFYQKSGCAYCIFLEIMAA